MIEVSAVISNDAERSAVMAWIRASKFHSYSEVGNTVHVSYLDDPSDPENSSRKWALIHYFEQYPEHEIKGKP